MTSSSCRPLRYLSLFSGIGGFEVGIHAVFPDAECVGFSEIDRQAIQVYQEHFPGHKPLGDVRTISGKLRIDLLVGGSPCQDLSAFNVKREAQGLSGAKSGLFYEFVRILRENQPRWFILENVGSMKNGEREAITEAMGIEPQLINSRLVSAQNRKRYYWTNIPLDRGCFADAADAVRNTRPRIRRQDDPGPRGQQGAGELSAQARALRLRL